MKLYIGNLPYDVSEVDLRQVLEPYEPIQDIHIPLDRETGSARGFAFVQLSSREIGEKAIEALNGTEVGGRPLRVSEAIERERRDNHGGGGGGGGQGKYRKEKSYGSKDKNDGPKKRYRSI